MTVNNVSKQQKEDTICESSTPRYHIDIWEGMMHVAEDVKSDVVKAALDTEIITTEAKLVTVAKAIIDRLFTEAPSSKRVCNKFLCLYIF